jgi:hypothetical protein
MKKGAAPGICVPGTAERSRKAWGLSALLFYQKIGGNARERGKKTVSSQAQLRCHTLCMRNKRVNALEVKSNPRPYRLIFYDI